MYGAATPKGLEMVLPVIDIKIGVLVQKLQQFFSEWVDFAYWWSSIGKGLRLQPAQQACFKCTAVLPGYSPSAPMASPGV